MSGRPKINPGKSQLVEQLDQLGSVASVAHYYRVDPSTVSRWLRKYGITDQRSRKRQLTDEQAREILMRGPTARPNGFSHGAALDIINGNTYREIW